MWLHSLKVAQLLRSAACLHTNQSRSYLNHLVILRTSARFLLPVKTLLLPQKFLLLTRCTGDVDMFRTYFVAISCTVSSTDQCCHDTRLLSQYTILFVAAASGFFLFCIAFLYLYSEFLCWLGNSHLAHMLLSQLVNTHIMNILLLLLLLLLSSLLPPYAGYLQLYT